MGTVILLQKPHETHFDIIDGQQRLLTLHLLRDLLQDKSINLASGDTPIQRVHQELARRVTEYGHSTEDLSGYGEFLETKATVLRIVTDDEDEAFQFFDSQNFRGKGVSI